MASQPTQSSVSHKLTLTRHTKAVNALAISPLGSLLLSGGNDSRVVVWNLSSGEMVQEFCIPSAGYISCLSWVKLSDRDEDAFAFGASDGNIHLYQRVDDSPTFSFLSITLGHEGAVESFAWDVHRRRLASMGKGEIRLWKVALDRKSFIPFNSNVEKQPYIARSAHFHDNGASVLVSYLESGLVHCYSIDPWDLKWKKKTNGRIGATFLDGQHLLVSNLRDGVDKYAVPALSRMQSFQHTILVNVPLQLSVAHDAGLLVVGGDNGFARIFDLQTGAFRGKLEHGGAGDLVVSVATFENSQGCLFVTGSALEGHSNIKVWTQSYQAPAQPALADTEVQALVSLRQIALFAIVCVFVNILMGHGPPSFLHDILLLILKYVGYDT